MFRNSWPLLWKFVQVGTQVKSNYRNFFKGFWKELCGLVWQPAISESIYDFIGLFRTVWQQQMHLRGHSLLHFMPKNVSEMTGHGDLVGKSSNMLPWHQKTSSPSPKSIFLVGTLYPNCLLKVLYNSYFALTPCRLAENPSHCTFLLLFSSPLSARLSVFSCLSLQPSISRVLLSSSCIINLAPIERFCDQSAEFRNMLCRN